MTQETNTPRNDRFDAVAAPVGWAYEFHDFGDIWARASILNRPDGKSNPPTAHYGSPVRHVRPFYEAAPTPITGAIAAVAAERDRQITKGYDATHDDGHLGGEIVLAEWGARARIEAAINAGRAGDGPAYKELLTQAAAQCIAEIERVERAATKEAE